MNRSGRHFWERNPARVLVVDDDRLVGDLVARWLQEAGYLCRVAGSVTQGSAWLASESFDLVTCDINMPGESGLQWLPRLVRDCPDLAVLMLTGCDDTRLAIEALTHGARAYLIKPVERDELLKQVWEVLERQQLLLERRQYTQVLERRIGEQTRRLSEIAEEATLRLTIASSVHDDETGDHIRRIGILSGIVAAQLGWPKAKVDMIRMAAPMHDIGKVGIPDAILRKPGKLTPEEFMVMQNHTRIGATILAGSQVPMLQMAERIALSHHEKWDGSGYPDGLSGRDIPPAARVVAVVDVYDALSHDRVYRPALPEEETLAILTEGIGQHFDPDVVAAFFTALPQVRRALEEDSSSSSLPAATTWQTLNATLMGTGA